MKKRLTEFKGFYEVLKENLESYRGKFDDIIYYCPELFKLLTNLLNENSIKADMRLKINAALSYFVAPNDVVPEEIYGPMGYIDDIFICAYVLRIIRDNFGIEFLEKNWNGTEPIEDVLDHIYEKSKKVVADKADEILVYAGLKS